MTTGGGTGSGEAALDPELVVEAEPRMLVFVVTDKPHRRAAVHTLSQDLEWHLRNVLSSALHLPWHLADPVPMGPEVLQCVEVPTVDAPARMADVQPG